MTRSLFSVSDPLRAVKEMIDETVSNFRNRGLPRTVATDEAAKALGITPRKAKALLYDETFKVSPDEYQSMEIRFWSHISEEADILSARSAAARARLTNRGRITSVQTNNPDRRGLPDRRTADRRSGS